MATVDMPTARSGSSAGFGRQPCGCDHSDASPSLIVLTGGPGAGKTAVLNIARERFCRHVFVLEEAASIVFGGGFPREDNRVAQEAAQRAIYHVQAELEAIATGVGEICIALCDRGTLDGLAYWPDEPDSFFEELGTTREAELERYSAVIHLRTPSPQDYNHANPLRRESPEQATAIDNRILEVWADHPRRVVIESAHDFFDKARRALAVVEEALPVCCRHPLQQQEPHHGD